jgi:hypothetical protein
VDVAAAIRVSVVCIFILEYSVHDALLQSHGCQQHSLLGAASLLAVSDSSFVL